MTNRSKQVRRVKRRNNNKDKFMFTNYLNLIKPYAKHHICIENFIYRFEINDIILFNKNYGFALIRYRLLTNKHTRRSTLFRFYLYQ